MQPKNQPLWNQPSSKDEIDKLCKIAVRQFRKIASNHLLFHLFFLLLLTFECIALFFSLPLFFKKNISSFFLATLFLTGFSYFSLRLYVNIKKPLQFRNLCADYLATCQELVSNEKSSPQYHITLSDAAYRLARYLYGQEYLFYRAPRWFQSLKRACEKLSCWLYWKDVFLIEELLLLHAVYQHIELVRCEPTNIEIHASLAHAYIMLSNLYLDPRKLEGFDEQRWVPPERLSKEIEEKHQLVAKRAIEEFTILSHYAPNDPWVHKQLAYSYHDLQMPKEEIEQYEKVLALSPNDHDILFKLGILYFQQGHNAQGLKIYEKFKDRDPEKADALIQFYGAHKIIQDIISPLPLEF